MKNIRKTAVSLVMACALIAAPALTSAAAVKDSGTVTETLEYKDGAKFSSVQHMKFEITSKKTAKVTGVTADYKKEPMRMVTNSATGKTGYVLSIPEKVEYKGKYYKVDEIGAKAFKGDKKVFRMIHGKTLKTIGKEAFANCSNLTGFFDVSVGDLTPEALAAMKSQGNTIPYVKSSVEVIGDRAFQNCSSLSIINFGSKIRKIGSKAFSKVGSKTVTIMLENKNLKASGVAKDFFSPSSKCIDVFTFSNVNKTCYLYTRKSGKAQAGKQKAKHSSGVWSVSSSRWPIIRSLSFKDYLTGKA